MKKRILSFLICCVMLVGLLPTVALADEGVTFTAITGTTGANDNEGYAKLFDGNSATKWCVTNFTSAYVIFKASEPMAVTGYSITTGNDNVTNPGRNPESWTLYGYTGSGEPNSSSTAWELIHSVTNDTNLKDKNQTAYNFNLTETAPAYQYFKLEISAIESGKVMQMSEFTLTSCDHEWDEGTVTAPTCTIKGYTEYTCTKCGNTKIANETAPLGHDFPGEDGACTHCKKTRAELYTFDVSKGRVMIADDEYSGKLLVYYFTQEDGLQRAEGYIDPSETITVTGSTTVNELHVVTTTPVTIKAKDLTINRYETSWAYAMSLDTSGADVTLILEGTNVFKGGSGRAGISVGAGRTLTIQGDGSLTATGRGNGAGIGGDAGSSCGTIIINSGTVTANGGEGIGKGNGGTDADSGSFSTGENGSAVIFANYSIGDKSRQDSWSGIIFEGGTGQVYGTPTLTADLTIPAGKSLTIPAGKSLTIPEDVTLKISPGATLTNSGAIYVDGTLSGTVGGTVYYPMTLTNCTASPVSNNNNKTYAAVGTSVILTADRPEFFQSWDITGAEGSASGSSYTITMPAGKVTAKANLSADAPTYTVTINAGANMTLTSGNANQSDLSSAMTATVYTASDGYYFPTDYSVEEVNGISVTRNSYTQITVSGTPTANTAITLAPATAKTKPAAPTGVTGVKCTTSENNNGKLQNVTAAMEYKKSDDSSWTDCGGTEVTGLSNGTYYVRVKATGTALASDYVEVTVEEYTAPSHIHSWAEDWSKNDTHHWHECTAEDCDVTNNSNKQGYGAHSFTAEKAEEQYLKSEATCTAKAVYYKSCADCGLTSKDTDYEATFDSGELNMNNHTDTTEWIQTATMHTQKYKCCGTIVVAEEKHEWENGVCTECEYVCRHSGGEATCQKGAECEFCGEIYSEPNPKNHSGNLVWIKDETQHEKKWDCCGETVLAPEDHTFVDGKCEICDYIAGHTHSLTKVEAKPATATEDGNKEYYTCDGCDKWFEDENGTTEITDKSSVTVPATGSTEDPTDPGDDDDLGCPFLRWLRDAILRFLRWIKNVSDKITVWFGEVFDNITAAFK